MIFYNMPSFATLKQRRKHIGAFCSPIVPITLSHPRLHENGCPRWTMRVKDSAISRRSFLGMSSRGPNSQITEIGSTSGKLKSLGSILKKSHRLITEQDQRWIHKASSMTFAVSTAGLFSAIPIEIIHQGHLSLPPDVVLRPLMFSWATSTIIQAVTGAYMAMRFRKEQTQVRNVFLANSTSSCLNAWIAWRTSGMLPVFLSSNSLHAAVMMFLCSTSFWMVIKAIYDAPQLISSRRERKKMLQWQDAAPEQKLGSSVWDYFNYIFPNIWGLPFFVLAARFSLGHGHLWYEKQFELYPTLSAVVVYGNIFPAFAVGVASLMVTLRDKKMISKKREAWTISATSSISLMCTLIIIHSQIGLETLFSFL